VAEFNAGSIEATLELDRDPFTTGLEMAKAQGKAVEDDPITAHLRVDMGDDEEKLAALKLELDSLHDKTIHVDVDEDKDHLASAARDVEDLGEKADGAGSSIARMGSSAAAAGGPGGGISLLAAGIGTLIPLLDPILGFGLGAVSSFGVAATGLGAWAAFAIPTLKNIESAQKNVTTAQQSASKQQESSALSQQQSLLKVQEAQEKLNKATDPKQRAADLQALQTAQQNYHNVVMGNAAKQQQANEAVTKAEQGLSPPMQEVLKQYQQFQTEFKNLQTQVAPGIARVFSSVLSLANQVLPELTGVVNATSTALANSVNQVHGFLTSPTFKGFMSFVQSNIGGQLNVFTGFLTNFAGGFINLVERSAPLMNAFDMIITDLGKGFQKMTVSPAFTQFVDAIAKDMPALEKFGADFFGAIGQLLVHLEPLVGPALQFLDALIQAIDKLITGGTLDALVNLLIVFLQTITPALPAIAAMLNSVVVPLANALVPVLQALQPLMPIIGPVVVALLALKTLEGPLGSILSMLRTIQTMRTGEAGGGILGKLGVIATGTGLGAAGGAVLGEKTEPGTGTQAKVGRDLTTAGGGLLGTAGGMAATGVGAIPAAFVAAAAASLIAAGEVTAHWSKVEGFLRTSWGKIEGFAKTTWGQVLVGIATGGISTIIMHWSTIVGKLDGIWQTVDRDARNWFGIVQRDISGFGRNIGNDAEHWATNVWQKLDGAWQTVDRNARHWWGDIEGFFLSIGRWFTGPFASFFTNTLPNTFTGTWNHIFNDARNWWGNIINFFGTIEGKIISVFANAGTWLLNIGESIIDGLLHGIQRGWSDLTGWIGNAASHLPGFIKHPLGIRSPSQVMADQVGQWIPKGIAKGIADNWGAVNDAIGPVNLRGSGGGGGNNTHLHITINNPVGETSDTSIHRTMQKVRFHGLLPPELWSVNAG
jgi:phage-related protein